MRGFSISTGTIEDLPAIMPVMATAFDPRFGEAWTEMQMVGALTMPGTVLVMACADRPVGFALARTIVDECELMMIAVDPAERRNGIGRALVSSVATTARTLGGSALFLEVRDGNPAVSLYSRIGFVPSGRRARYYRGNRGEAFDALTFRLAL